MVMLPAFPNPVLVTVEVEPPIVIVLEIGSPISLARIVIPPSEDSYIFGIKVVLYENGGPNTDPPFHSVIVIEYALVSYADGLVVNHMLVRTQLNQQQSL